MSRRFVVLLLAIMASAPVVAREDVNAPAREAELRTCLNHTDWIAPPDATIADKAAFCNCYADGAVKDRLWELERAEANEGEEVRRSVADRTISLHDRKSAAIAASCLKH
ncbi:hypothetical protein SAMN05216360_103287 [Methylobacterium phyllostachyos]|uniref:HdeA/HdeB family protein n=1 Tax=Methylobacterium phyllostachyos TaxID=582672 RepID=A0A1G9VT07_9HYPH|nr:hypothetical protein [Methylobacterium phyllostachyos]SDM75283.1 hypothetical protein SAMN05216360_103287 [Methylobacterium phyllostachyos]